MAQLTQNYFLRTSKQALVRFRRWRWFVPALVGGAVIVLLPAYFVAAQFGHLPAALKPATLLHNSLGVVTQTITGQQKPSPTPTASQKPAAGGTGNGATSTAKPSNGSAGSASNAPQASQSLIFSQPVLTVSSVPSNTTSDRPTTYVSAPNNVKISEPQVEGSRADVGTVVLPTQQNGWYPTDFNQKWAIYAQRGHADGGGTTYYTVTAHDQAGTVYTATLTVKWPPIPYFTLAPGRVEIITGNSPQWGALTGIVVHVTLQPSVNFGAPNLHFGASLPNYPCMGAPGVVSPVYPTTLQYSGNNDLADACWFYPGQVTAIRQQSATAHVTVSSDLYTDFATQSTDVTVPAW